MSELVAKRRRKGTSTRSPCRPTGRTTARSSDLPEEVRLKITNANPDGSSAEENQAIMSLKGTRGRRTSSTTARPSRSRAPRRGSAPRTRSRNWATIPRQSAGPEGPLDGDYWGAISIGYNAKLVNPAPTSFKDLMKLGLQGPGRTERQPAHVGLGRRRRVRRRARATAARSSNVGPASTSSRS